MPLKRRDYVKEFRTKKNVCLFIYLFETFFYDYAFIISSVAILKEYLLLSSDICNYPFSIAEKLTPEENELLVDYGDALLSKQSAGKDCCICGEHKGALGISCSQSHFTCVDCLNQYVVEKSSFESTSQTSSLMQRRGHIICPLAPDPAFPSPMLTCTSRPYSDQELASILSSETYEKFQAGLYKNADQEAFDKLMLKYCGQLKNSNEFLVETMKRNFPDARQCGGCGHGPITYIDSPNLAARGDFSISAYTYN